MFFLIYAYKIQKWSGRRWEILVLRQEHKSSTLAPKVKAPLTEHILGMGVGRSK